MLQNIEFKTEYLGFSKNTNTLDFNIYINGVKFDYFMGVGHATPIMDGVIFGDRGVKKRAVLELLKYKIFVDKFLHLIKPNKPPELEEVLNCLFVDSQSVALPFEEWAEQVGYDVDSRKAEKLHKECKQQWANLHLALGSDYYRIQEYIQDLEL